MNILRSGTSAALVFAGAVVSFSMAGGAETHIVGVPGSNEKTVAKLSVQMEALEMRVKKLEKGLIDVQRSVKKPDEPDDDGGSDKSDKKGGDGGKDTNAGAKESSSSGGAESGSSSNGGDSSGSLKDVSHPTVPTMTLRAPFVVVDSAGKTIFRVNDPQAKGGKSGGERGVYIYGDGGVPNFSVTTVFSGAKLWMQNNANSYSMSMGALDKGAGLKLRADDKLRTFFGLDTKGNGLIDVYNTDGNDQPAASLQTTDAGKGMVAVFNSGTPVAFLTQSGAHPGGGNVTTTDPGGNGVFSAGYDGEAGAACVNHKQSTHCLGIGLPLGGGQ